MKIENRMIQDEGEKGKPTSPKLSGNISLKYGQKKVKESLNYKNAKIDDIRKKINEYFSPVKKAAQIVAISSVGIFPSPASGQDVDINNIDQNSKIENNEQLKNQIFSEVVTAYNNGILRNNPNNVYYFELQKDGYDISYNLDTNLDGENDSIPQINILYVNGNNIYRLDKGQNGISSIDREIVYNYRDALLPGSEIKTYGEFAGENIIVIPELTGKNDAPVHVREINKEEMEKFLDDITEFSETIDSGGIRENENNIRNQIEKDRIYKEGKEKEEKDKELQMKPFSDLYNFLKQNTESFGISHNEGESSHFVKGKYSYDFDESGYLRISFIDDDGYKNFIRANFTKENFGINQAIKIKRNEGGNSDRQEISGEQIGKIINETLLDIKK